LRVQKNIPEKFFGLLSFKSNFKLLFIFNFLISVFIFDLVKAESNNATLNSNNELAIDYLDSRSKLEDLNLDSETIELILENAKNRTEIDIDYLDPKNELEDYIVDTGAGGKHKRRRGFFAKSTISLHKWFDKNMENIIYPWLNEVNKQTETEIKFENNSIPFK